ncbi:hypothetical protein H5410_036790 [Solanum commersonii]|uniref:Uncharacterized protein n=1 Tax=Solanum commersonii TaxID=4109 RepID=A0A9J5Y985_SOLCO|nr:hypothetical protein H5410_036790 [Solanum commersonii]
MGLKIAFCFSVLCPKGKGQVGDEMEQSAHRRSVLRSSTISPNDSKCKRLKAMKSTKRQIAEHIGNPY